ncbi:MAG: signal peptidase II [candidate division KSB1 bacterium]|nr:signal peptidase II [candidate division KSB1 bacterium]
MQKSNLRILLYSGWVILLDQATKFLARYFLQGEHPSEPRHSFSVIGDLIRLTFVENPGMAFGLRLGGKTFFTIFASLASLAILVYLFRIKGEKLIARLALALILGGAIGNLIDRIAFGQVVDFIDIGIGTTRWPVFNVADIAVTVGMIILLTVVFLQKEEVETKSESRHGGEEHWLNDRETSSDEIIR